MAIKPFIPLEFSDAAEHRRKLAEAIDMLFDGHSANTGTVTLGAGSTTTLTDGIITESSQVLLLPRTANAAAAGAYVSSVENGSAVIEHQDSASTDRTFGYAVIG